MDTGKIQYKERNLEKKIDRLWGEKEMLVIKGPRQAGKTTLLRHLQEKYGGTYYTLEDEEVLRSFNSNPELLVDSQVKFIDEVQLSPFAGRRLKFLYDKFEGEVKFVVSGSGAFDLKREVGASLVGRAFFLSLLPLSFEEFVKWKSPLSWRILAENKKRLFDFIQGKGEIEPMGGWEALRELALQYMVWGGYPAVVLTKDREMKKERLKNIVELTVERDLVRLFSFQDIGRMKKVVKTLSSRIGRLLKMSDLEVDFKTAEKYIGVLEYSQIISLLEPFHRNERTALRKARKVYFCDLGFRNALLNNFSDIETRENAGFLIENFVFRQLCYDFPLKYWRTTNKTEVDFVIEEPLVAIEVKFGKAKALRGIKSFMDKYGAKGIVMCEEFKKAPLPRYPFWLM